jgi:hypothetical protein
MLNEKELAEVIESPRAKTVLDLLRPIMPDVAFEIHAAGDRTHGTEGPSLFVTGTDEGNAMEYGVVTAGWPDGDSLLRTFEEMAKSYARKRRAA